MAKKRSANSVLASLPKFPPRFVEPMKPRLVENPPSAGDWLYEIKFDGIRALAIKKGRKVSLLSRNKKDLAGRFPELIEPLSKLKPGEFVLDGEIVAMDEKGRSSFQLLQGLEMEGRKSPVFYYIFDLLQADGRSFMGLPLMQRKEWLAQFLSGAREPLRISANVGDDPQALLEEVRRLGLEGIIGKQRSSVYESGQRTGAWIKLKCLNEQEFVIGGYTPPAGSRKYFGAILVGYYEKSGRGKGGGQLKFAGKVGTGFNSKSLATLFRQFQGERSRDCPFVDVGRGGLGPGEVRKCTWLNPVFVAQIKFAEWTRDGKLRQPVFLGLREDKRAIEVTREA